MSNIAFLFLPLAFSSLAVLPFVSPSSQVIFFAAARQRSAERLCRKELLWLLEISTWPGTAVVWICDSLLPVGRELGEGVGDRNLRQGTADRELGTGDLGQGTGGRELEELGTGNWGQQTGDRELGQGTGDRELGTRDLGQGTGGSKLGTGSWGQRTGGSKLGTGNWDGELGTGNWGQQTGNRELCMSSNLVIMQCLHGSLFRFQL